MTKIASVIGRGRRRSTPKVDRPDVVEERQDPKREREADDPTFGGRHADLPDSLHMDHFFPKMSASSRIADSTPLAMGRPVKMNAST
jgi:hypothetical protein